MYSFLIAIPVYPYPYQHAAMFIAFLVVLLVGSATYGIYRLIIWKMNIRVKTVFHNFLKIVGISIVVLFLAEMTVSLITEHHVNIQLGFNCATPETPEGEIFQITKIVPGKTMDKAGLKPGDRVQMVAVSDLYRLLINNQGKDVAIAILRDKKEININIRVPKLDVPMAGVSFLFEWFN